MKHRYLPACLLLLAGSLPLICGCTVVKDAKSVTPTVLQTLGDWKEQASTLTADPDYDNARRTLNVWIEAKAKEIKWAAPELFTQVDLTIPPKVFDAVEKNFLKKKVAPASVASIIFDWLLEEYKSGRLREGAAVSSALRDYLWPPLKK